MPGQNGLQMLFLTGHMYVELTSSWLMLAWIAKLCYSLQMRQTYIQKFRNFLKNMNQYFS